MTPRFRSIPLLSVAPVALICATLAVAAHGSPSHANPQRGLNARQLAFHDGMRKLWEDHITWTRLAIVSFAGGLPDLQATETRLLANQTDIGNAVKPFYGAAAGKQLTALLREHILIAADLIAVAQKGDEAGVSTQQTRWTKNADQIADFLSGANPRHWKQGEMRHMMHEHLRLTTNEVVARLTQNWTADVKAYDRVEREILQMSEMLADGLVAQFPSRFA